MNDAGITEGFFSVQVGDSRQEYFYSNGNAGTAVPQFAFYAIGYAMERVLSMSRSDISGFLPPKVRSQQITLFKYFKIADCGK